MESLLPVKVKMDAQLISRPSLLSILPIGTWWTFEHYRQGVLIDQWEQKNVTMYQGLDHMLDATFHGSMQITSWYLGLFSDDYTPLVSDTYAVPGFTETDKYTSATRVAYVEAAASSRVTTNTASKASFTINDTVTIYGAMLVGGGTDADTKLDTAGGGTLFCAAKFASAKPCVNTDVLMVTCAIALADA